MKIKSDVHMHTSYCDGTDSPERMVRGAIAAGCTTAGFSGHSYLGHESDWAMSEKGQKEYIANILALRDKYAGQIQVLLGIEQDYGSGAPEYAFDYVIGSVHAVMKNGMRIEVDDTPKSFFEAIRELYGGDAMAMVRDYYALVAGVADRTHCDIIGHFDLITKFNEKFPFVDTGSHEYLSVAFEALDVLIEKHKIFEINTGAVARGWKTRAYSEEPILRRLAEKKASVMLASDAHCKKNILYGFEDAAYYAKSCGIRELCVYNGKKIEKVLI